jgi:hypothetical protein
VCANQILLSLAGTVDPATLKVTLSPAINVTSNADYETSMAIAGISATKFVIVYHNYAAVLDTLYAVVMTGSVVSPGVNKVEFTSVVANSFTGYTINGTFKATTLTRSATGLSEVVVAYINAKTRAGLSCTLFAVNPTTGTIIDGSSLAITTGSSAAAYSSMSIVTIGTGSQFMVMFTNSLLQGATMAAIGQVKTCKCNSTALHHLHPPTFITLISQNFFIERERKPDSRITQLRHEYGSSS